MLSGMASPTRPSPATPNLAQIGMFVGIFVFLANAAFFFLSWMYFEDKRDSVNVMLGEQITDSHIMSVRVAFAIFSVVVGAASFVAGLAPRIVGHAIAALVGLGSLIAAFIAFAKDLPTVLPMTLLVLGAGMPILAWLSFDQRSRPAWSFLLATCLVYATCTFFGAPKVRGLLHVDLWTALILPGLLVVAGVSLLLAAADYKERAA
jgi:hypothetical protein